MIYSFTLLGVSFIAERNYNMIDLRKIGSKAKQKLGLKNKIISEYLDRLL